VIAGFSTTFTGSIIYSALCITSLGLAYLVFRWFPRWRVRLMGKPTPLRISQWVAIEVSHNPL
jgi:cation-transporting ATPase 13A3/4/5